MLRPFLLVNALLTIPASAAAQPAVNKFPPELVTFVPYKTNPVFSAAKGQWDAKIRERGWIMRDAGVYKLWYTGYDGTKDGIRRLGYATSKDGIAWMRHPMNPLIKDLWVEDMMIVKDASGYFMFAEGEKDRAHWLVSADGVDWTPKGKLDIRTKNGQPIADGPFGTPTVFRDQDRWYLFYERDDLAIWLASSRDFKVWTHVQDEPVMKPGPAPYDKDQIAFNQVIKHQGRYYAYYHGSANTGPNKGLWSTNVATSTDLIHWEKYPGNPLLPIKANKSSGIVVHDGRGFRLYTMHPEVYLHVPRK